MLSSLCSPSELSSPLAVIACDAGAANIIAAWAPLLPKQLHICVEGPAKHIFKKTWPSCEFQALDEVIANSKMVLTGTGWSSTLEHNARRCAKDAGLITLAVIDHWVNYRARFVREHNIIFPDVIVVTDPYAELEAKRCFEQENIKITQWPNYYLELEAKKVKLLRQEINHAPPRKILMVMEPIRAIWPGDLQQGEFVAAGYFLSNMGVLGFVPEQVQIRIRPHPSDVSGKYDEVVYNHPSINICVSKDSLLAEEIAWADLVVGCNSFALAVAITSGVPTMSVLPPQAPPCVLPHKGIQHLTDLVS